jgi:putative FmdB family regulatory protein
MPTYSYRCTQCSTAFDIQQAFTDDSLTECPTCQGLLRKIFSAVGVTFNGSGFYRTDSRADGANKSAKAGASAKSSGSNDSTGSGGGGSSDSSGGGGTSGNGGGTSGNGGGTSGTSTPATKTATSPAPATS